MERRKYIQTIGTILGIAGVAGCTDNGGGNGDKQTSPSPQKEGGNTVQMVTKNQNYYFDPVGLFVNPGETVTFTIKTGSHSSTAYKKGNASASVTRIPKEADAWNSEILSGQGKTFKHTFKSDRNIRLLLHSSQVARNGRPDCR
jgi:plastocyanin